MKAVKVQAFEEAGLETDKTETFKPGLEERSTDKTEKMRCLTEPIGEDSEGDREGDPGMGSFRRPKAIIDIRESICSWVARLSEIRTEKAKE